MATTRLIPLHAGKGRTVAKALGRTTDYVKNPEKTNGGELVTAYQCNPAIADQEFLFSKRQYATITGRDQKEHDVIAYHLRQSFRPGEVTPEQANKIGYDLAMSLTKGKHAFIVCTHVDKQHINTLESDNEMLLTIHSAFSQAESEAMSSRVKWGKREAMREGRAIIQYNRLYGYRRGENNKPEIIPEQAEVVRRIYKQYLAGASLRMIQETLESEQIPNVEGKTEWTLNVIRGIFTNEKYYGDVLMQKTYVNDCISRKTIRNNGQLPKYLLPDHHEGIVDRQTFDAVQTEMARRNAGRSPSRKNAPTGRTSYASKYALSERLVCGECGPLYRRCVWAKRGKKRTVWRCVSRLDYGTKYCHNSPTLDEEPLQRAILAAINTVMGKREDMASQISEAMELELAPVPWQTISLADIQRRLDELEGRFNNLLEQAAEQTDGQNHMAEFQSITNEIAGLKEQRARLEAQRRSSAAAAKRMDTVASLLMEAPPELTEWNESTIRQVVDTVRVVSAEEIVVYLQGGITVTQEIAG